MSSSDPTGLAHDVLESLLEGCQVISFDHRYLYLNETAARQGGRAKDDLLGRTMAECYPGIDHTPMFETLQRCLTDRVHGQMTNEFSFPDGSAGWFELRFVPVPEGACILSMDITERKRSESAMVRMEQQLRQAQKLEAIGRLAGGIAHDFNNVLSVILSYTVFIDEALEPGEPMRDDVGEIRAAALRATDLTKQLLAFSRQQAMQPKIIDLNQVVAGSEKMLRRLLGADVALTVLPFVGLWKVKVDPSQFDQVLMNLAINARDAMPSGGKLVIETQNVNLDEDYARMHHGVTPGAYVKLAITDNGVGMDRDTQARIFEPFFTTKEKDKGTGLGLATVFGIIKQSGGHIWLYSEPGHGTTFKVYLPRTVDPESIRHRSDTEQTQQQPPARGNETILLVEDDDQVRAIAVNILRRNGYRVLEASNGGEAFMICEDHSATIHLLVTDVVLPRMSGRQLAERLTPMRPQMKILYMSGYTDDAVLQHGILESNVAYLQKPLTPDALTRKVRDVLNGA